MSMLATIRTNCRLCGSADLELAIPMAPTPVAEKYLSPETINTPVPSFPLELHMCRACGHVQLLHVVDPSYLYADFTYRSAGTTHLVEHFEECASMLEKDFKLRPGSLVVDIGSNDGSLLKSFLRRGHRVLGVDPATEIAEAATRDGVPTVPEFLSEALVSRIVAGHGAAGAVCAFNVYAHADDLAGMTECVSRLLAPDGLFMFECSYLLDIIQKRLLGTIFHEHLSHHSVTPLVPFLRSHGLELLDVRRNPIQGGSIVGIAQRLGGPRSISQSVHEIITLEADAGLHTEEVLRSFSQAIAQSKQSLLSFVAGARAEGRRFWGFGAARSGTTLLGQLGIGPFIERIVDDNPQKHSLYTAADRIPIGPVSSLYQEMPDYTFIIAWVHAENIISQHRDYLERGGRFILCFPDPELVSAAGREKL